MAFVQSNHNSQTSSTPTVTLPSNTAGNLLVVAIEAANADTKILISDTGNNTWQTGGIITNAGGWRLRTFYAENCAASVGTNTVTFTLSGSYTCRMSFAEYSGVVTTNSYGGSRAVNGSSTTASTGSFACTSGDLIVAFSFMLGSSITVGSGYTSRGGADSFILLEDKTAGSSSETATTTGSTGAWTIVAVAFRQSSPASSKYVQGDITSSKGGSVEVAYFPNNTSGNVLIAFTETGAPAETVAITDSAGNTWVLLGTVTGPVSSWTMCAWYVASCVTSSGKNTVTATFSASVGFHRLSIAEYDATSVAVVVSSINRQPTVTSIAAPNIPASNDAVILACSFAAADGGAVGSGYTQRKVHDTGVMLMEDKESSSAAAPDITCTSGEAGIIAVSIGAGYTAGADFPAVTDVRDGVSYGGGTYTGTVELPAEADVEDGVMYGAGGTEFEGTLVAGGGATGWTY